MKVRLLQFLLSNTCLVIKKKLQAFQKTKRSLQRQSKHQNQTCKDAGTQNNGHKYPALMDKVDSMNKHKGNVSRDGNFKRESEMSARDQNTVTQMKSAFDGLI